MTAAVCFLNLKAKCLNSHSIKQKSRRLFLTLENYSFRNIVRVLGFYDFTPVNEGFFLLVFEF